MDIKILNNFSTDAPYNLALEAYLLDSATENQALLYIWQNKNCVVIGKNQNPWKECRVQLLEEEGGRLIRRNSGGGAVFHDLGNLNFSFIMSKAQYDLERQLEVIISACKYLGIPAYFSGRNDILVDGMKFSGNAFKHTKHSSLHHGTILISADMELLGRYLAPPKQKIQSKGIDSVRSRVCNLNEFRPELTPEIMRAALEEAFVAEYGNAQKLEISSLPEQPILDYADLFSTWNWNFGETLPFDICLENRFAWGGIEINLSLKNATIASVRVYSDSIDETISSVLETALLGLSYDSAIHEAVRGLAEASTDESIKLQYSELADFLLDAGL